MKKINFLFIVFILSACASSPQVTDTPLDVTEVTQINPDSNGGIELPIPNEVIHLPKVIAAEYTDIRLNKRLYVDYKNAVVKSYDNDGNSITLDEYNKPDGRAAFMVDNKEFVLGYGINGELLIMMKDGNQYIQFDFSDQAENASTYNIYVDPVTGKVTDKINSESIKIPVLTILENVSTGDSSLLYYDYRKINLGSDGFYQVVRDNIKIDNLASLVNFDAMFDMSTAPDFITQIDFGGDWKVKRTVDGVIDIYDVTNDKILGRYENGGWIEIGKRSEQVAVSILEQYTTNPDDYSISSNVDGIVNVIEKETEKLILQSSENGIVYDIGFALDHVAKHNCEQTEFRATPNGLLIAENNGNFLAYMGKLLESGKISPNHGDISQPISSDIQKQCWTVLLRDQLVYRGANGVVYKLSIFHMERNEINDFLNNR